METPKDNIYAATEVNLLVEENGPEFYVVATRKFWILNISTLGLYSIYWFYENWRLYKKSTGESVWPVPRAIFSIFFAHRLCEIINTRILRKGIDYTWPWKGAATTFVFFAIIGSICDRLAGKDVGSPFTDLVSVVILPVTSWALWRIQMAINVACEDPTGESNHRLTAANVVWIIIGTLVWLLFFIGVFAMD
jgi:hypothetical protein